MTHDSSDFDAMKQRSFEEAFQEVRESVGPHDLAWPFRESTVHFGGETPHEAIEGLAEWSAANAQQDRPQAVRDIRMRENHGSVPRFAIIATLDELA